MILVSCEEEFVPDVSTDIDEIVVEGYVEAGENVLPPHVILTRSRSFFSSLGSKEFENLFVHNAKVEIKAGQQVVLLPEICLNDLDDMTRAQVASTLGFNPDSLTINFCVYVDLSGKIVGEIGKKYELEITIDGKKITAETTIPTHVPLDSIRWEKAPGGGIDSLAQLLTTISDPPIEANFYRVFTKVNEEPFLTGINSLTDDAIFDGKTFEFRLNKAEPADSEASPGTFGLFTRGDTVQIKWTNIDEDHFNFWNTLEFNRNNQGPFSSYTRIDSNINGGLGIWGGYSISHYRLIVPLK